MQCSAVASGQFEMWFSGCQFHWKSTKQTKHFIRRRRRQLRHHSSPPFPKNFEGQKKKRSTSSDLQWITLAILVSSERLFYSLSIVSVCRPSHARCTTRLYHRFRGINNFFCWFCFQFLPVCVCALRLWVLIRFLCNKSAPPGFTDQAIIGCVRRVCVWVSYTLTYLRQSLWHYLRVSFCCYKLF